VNYLRSSTPQGGSERAGFALGLVAPLVILLAPFAPHFAEECWERLGNRDASVFDARWPAFDEDVARAEEIELVVQVNGRVRGKVRANPGLAEADAVALALAEPGVMRHVDGKAIKKAVYVQDRLVSLVV
jgi:leucyl-tRNA synthetase